MIRFRIRDLHNKCYISFRQAVQYFNVLITRDGLEQLNGNYIIERDTGVKDKSGQNIFEGHIVEYHNERFIIKFIREHAMFMMVYEQTPTMATHFKEVCPANVEIVGNVHEEELE